MLLRVDAHVHDGSMGSGTHVSDLDNRYEAREPTCKHLFKVYTRSPNCTPLADQDDCAGAEDTTFKGPSEKSELPIQIKVPSNFT